MKENQEENQLKLSKKQIQNVINSELNSAMSNDGRFIIFTYGGETGEGSRIYNQGYVLHDLEMDQELLRSEISKNLSLKRVRIRHNQFYVVYEGLDRGELRYHYDIIRPESREVLRASIPRKLRTSLKEDGLLFKDSLLRYDSFTLSEF